MICSVMKGSPRQVYDELCRMKQLRQQPSLSRLADRTGYHEVTVWRALQRLQDWGLVRVEQHRPGQRAEYEVLEYV